MSSRAPEVDIMETDLKQLVGLIAEDDIGERFWGPEKPAAILRQQMTAPLRGAVDWALGQLWLEDITRIVFTDGRRFLAGRGGRPARVAADGRSVQGHRP